MFKPLITAIRTLTIFPVPGKDTDDFSSSLYWFPVVGLLLGGLLYGLYSLAGLCGAQEWPQAAAVLILAASVLFTRGLHLDGLADWADGFGGNNDKQKILAIMKDSHVGAFGVMALLLVLLAKWVALVQLAVTGNILWVIAAAVVSRAAMVELSATLPYARAEGGIAGAFIKNAGVRHRLVAWSLSLCFLIVLLGVWSAGGLVFGFIVTRLFGWSTMRRVGGVTGDLLGACSELVETALLLLSPALIPFLP